MQLNAAHSAHSIHIQLTFIAVTYNQSGCTKKNLNHGVLLVGYGPGYWLVKNSFGPKWGDDGYIKIAKGHNNCGIDSWAMYPLV